MDISGQILAGRENSKCKGPGVGTFFTYTKIRKEDGAEHVRSMTGGEVQGGQGQFLQGLLGMPRSLVSVA